LVLQRRPVAAGDFRYTTRASRDFATEVAQRKNTKQKSATRTRRPTDWVGDVKNQG